MQEPTSNGNRLLPTGTSESTTTSSSRMGSTPASAAILDAHKRAPQHPAFLPNIPVQPVNGMIKTYDTTHRTFSRPYSAKNVYFYREGDHFFSGLRVPISKSRYRNMDSLLDDLNSSIPMPFGVRRLTTPYGRTTVNSLDQLQHLGKYVVSSTKVPRPLDMDAVERHQQRLREITQRRWERLHDRAGGGDDYGTGRWRTARTYGLFLPLTAKQLFFILNGHPGKIYRLVLNPYRRMDMERLYEEVSQGLEIAIVKFYAFSGKRLTTVDHFMELKESRVLAVPRHEKPLFPAGISKESSSSGFSARSNVSTLPPINRANMFHHAASTTTHPTTRAHTLHLIQLPLRAPVAPRDNHSIERTKFAPLPRVANATVTAGPPRRTFNYRRPEPRRDASGAATGPGRPAALVKAPTAVRRLQALKQRRTGPLRMPGMASPLRPSKESSIASASLENDSDSGRPRSTRSLASEEYEDEDDLEEEEESEDADADDYPEMPEGVDALSDIDSIDSPPPSRDSNPKNNSPRSRPVSSSRRQQAAVTIQAHVRGHLARKRHPIIRRDTPGPGAVPSELDDDTPSSDDDGKEEENEEVRRRALEDLDYSEPEQSEHPDSPDSGANGNDEDDDDGNGSLGPSEPEQSEHPDSPEPEEAEDARRTAAVTIQRHVRGFLVRRGRVPKQREPEGVMESEEEEEEHSHTDFLDEHEPEAMQEEQGDQDIAAYLVAVHTGNRWSAETESDLYVVLHGELGTSDKHYLRQEFTNWLQHDNPKFQQSRVDEFVIQTKPLGQLLKLTIGHEHPGYGGGVYLDQVIVTEQMDPDPRRYLFQMYMWLDSGQVDGKLERTLQCTAIHFIDSTPQVPSKGRWELVLHNGTAEGEGATTSNLNIFGYGPHGMSRSVDIYDNSFMTVPSTSLVQVDFGEELGELVKVRIEIDGNGTQPDYYLDFVELRDIDTDERMQVAVGKWLRWESEEKGAQAFRELVVFHGRPTTPPLFTYEGKMWIPVYPISFCSSHVKLELLGDSGESGVFPASMANKKRKHDKYDVSFSIEAVSVGRINGIRVYFDPTGAGQAVFEGLSEVQRIMDKSGVDAGVGVDFLVSSAVVRESQHAPYRTLLGEPRVQVRSSPTDSFCKELRFSRMEGLSTRLSRKKQLKRKTPVWVVSMILEEGSNLLPEVTLCGEKTNAVMTCLDTTPVDNIVGFQLKHVKIGALQKIRVAVDRTRRLNVLPDDEENTPVNRVYVKKIRIVDAVNGDELRYPVAEIELFEYSVFEFSAIWPDVPPRANDTYEMTLSTGESRYSAPFFAHLNIIGEHGDTGFRYLGDSNGEHSTAFEHDSQKVFQFEAVSVGELQAVELMVENATGDFVWECQEVVVVDPNTGLLFVFRFTKPFTPSLLRQRSDVSPLTAAL